jgi:hypothetical protein
MMLSQGQLGLGQATGSLAGQQAALAQGQLGTCICLPCMCNVFISAYLFLNA